MNYNGYKIGIIGYGVVGKSIVDFFKVKFPEALLYLTDQRSLKEEEQHSLKRNAVTFVSYDQLIPFVTLCDYIFISPGFDRTPFVSVQHKWLEEVDLFFEYVKKPVIAITGSAGKTSTVLLLEHILQKQNIRARACGNVGFPLLAALLEQDTLHYFIAELSSFQLEFANQCTPDIALLTNLSDNHLDRHKTVENYKNAKSKIFAHQKSTQYACLPFEFYADFASVLENQKVVLFSSFSNDYNITQKLSDITCLANWNSICTILELIEKLPSIELLETYCSDFILEHRVEFVRTYKNMKFYNDSKSTLPLSTENALLSFKNQPIILMIGGFSKGVNRKPFIQSLPEDIIHIICFGLEAPELGSFCALYGKPFSIHETIKEAFEQSITITSEPVVILFSPSGATHTHEFANYKERGNYFKSLVHSL